MPLNISAETPRNTRLIGGITVKIPAPYAEGHTVTAGEAAMLNQTLAENFSNNLRKRVEAFVPEGAAEGTTPRAATEDEAQALVDAYAGVYEPGVRRSSGGGGRKTLDPVEKEMRVIARESLNNLLQRQGLKKSDVDYDQLLDDVLDQKADALRSKAEKIIAARQKNTLDDLDVSIIANGGGEGGEPAKTEEAVA